jgi:predicted DNA-binding transcriptional regulator YafY
MAQTANRLLQLLSLLQARSEWAAPELADRLGIADRTVRRDIERLRDLGYPVESTRGPAGGYRLRAGTAMPPLLLDDEEAIAIAVGLRTAARASVTGIEEAAVRALVKLEQVLPSHLRRRVAALGAATIASPLTGPTVDPQELTDIAAACRDRECLRFGYRRRDGSASERLVEPHALVNLGRRWYLVAWDREREDWRTFRLDRLTRPRVAGRRFPPRRLPAKGPAAFVEQSISGAFSRFDARVTVHLSADKLAPRVAEHWGTIEPLDAERCEFRSSDDNLDWLALRIVMLGADFVVEEPPELAEHMSALAERIARAAAKG